MESDVPRSRWNIAGILQRSMTETETLMTRLGAKAEQDTDLEAIPCST